MGLFQRLFGGGATPPPPLGVDLIPGKLSAQVYAHDFASGPTSLPCWTYVTRGFSPAGQKEFVFTLVRGRGDDPASPPADPLRFFSQIFPLAERKQFVDAGGFTCFRPPPAAGFLGLRGMVGFVYTRPEAIPGVEMPPLGQCLTAILLLPGEAELVQAGWGYRVLVRLGRASRYYPHPPWSDPRRMPVLDPGEVRLSLLGQMPGTYVNGACARMFIRPAAVPEVGQTGIGGPLGDRLALRIRRDQLPRVRELIAKVATGAEGAFAMTLDADPDANARLAWQPGDTAPFTITPAQADASCLTGGFLALVFGPSIAEGGRVTEDGFALTLGPNSWSQLRDALTNGTPVTLPAKGPDQLGLSVEWIDGLPGATSQGSPAPAPAAFRIESMQLYQPDEVLRERMPSVESLAEFVKRVEAAGADFWNEQPAGKPQSVLVVAAVKPGGLVRVWVEVPPDLGAEAVAREFAARLGQLPAPVVQRGPVAVAMRATLWGGGGEWPFIPKEWQSAATAAGGSLLVPDGILERIWPD